MLYGKCADWVAKNKDKIDKFIKDNPEVTVFGRMTMKDVRDAGLQWIGDGYNIWAVQMVKITSADGKEDYHISPQTLEWIKNRSKKRAEAISAISAGTESILERLRGKLSPPSVNGGITNE
jgi:hypothetical protein